MIAPISQQPKVEKTSTLQTPSIEQGRWRFGGLTAAELLPLLQRYLLNQDSSAKWQLIWLNNDGQPVIGLLPKVSWTVYFHQASNLSYPTYKVMQTCRDSGSVTTAYMSYADWQDELIAYSKTYENNNSNANSSNEKSVNPSYQHGLMGFIGYDIAAHELSSSANIHQAAQPCTVLGHYDIYLTPNDISNNRSGWVLNVHSSDTNTEKTIPNTMLTALITYLEALDKELSNKGIADKLTLKPSPLMLIPQWQKSNYQQAFAQTQHYLLQGDCYQINLTQAWQGRMHDSSNHKQTLPMLFDYLPALHNNTNAPFAGYLGVNNLETTSSKTASSENDSLKTKDSKHIGFELLSCSPELFFTFIKDDNSNTHHIRTKPIKGTMPRGMTAEQDLILKQQLIDSNKDRAENVMIVDLLRNDLGKYAKVGSVKVPQLFNIESFSNVHHMVSTITAELKTETHPLAVLFGSLPAGSITGTPKKRAVEIIAELEVPARGAYCGTLGYMNFDGSGQWNVLIRTLQANHNAHGEKQVSLWAGGGITIASNCDDEYQECLDKVGNLLKVLAQTDSAH